MDEFFYFLFCCSMLPYVVSICTYDDDLDIQRLRVVARVLPQCCTIIEEVAFSHHDVFLDMCFPYAFTENISAREPVQFDM